MKLLLCSIILFTFSPYIKPAGRPLLNHSQCDLNRSPTLAKCRLKVLVLASHSVRIKLIAVLLAVLASRCPYRHLFRCDSHCRRNKAVSLHVKAQQVNDTRVCSLTDCTVCTNVLAYRSQSQWRPRSEDASHAHAYIIFLYSVYILYHLTKLAILSNFVCMQT